MDYVQRKNMMFKDMGLNNSERREFLRRIDNFMPVIKKACQKIESIKKNSYK